MAQLCVCTFQFNCPVGRTAHSSLLICSTTISSSNHIAMSAVKLFVRLMQCTARIFLPEQLADNELFFFSVQTISNTGSKPDVECFTTLKYFKGSSMAGAREKCSGHVWHACHSPAVILRGRDLFPISICTPWNREYGRGSFCNPKAGVHHHKRLIIIALLIPWWEHCALLYTVQILIAWRFGQHLISFLGVILNSTII